MFVAKDDFSNGNYNIKSADDVKHNNIPTVYPKIKYDYTAIIATPIIGKTFFVVFFLWVT